MTKNNDVSGLTNLARNIGGSVGTAFVVTVLARRQQFHQDRLGSVISPGNSSLQSALNGMGNYLMHAGRATTLSQGQALAQGNLYGQLIRQSSMLAYLDVIKVLAVIMMCLIPLVFLMKRPPKGGRPMGH